ncbi:MAG: MMPL family transporter, partial [Streptosporangiaceae bacterium]
GSQIVDVGVGLALGILMDTFIVRTILVPCTVVLLGRWNWWPSKLGQVSPEAGGGEGTARDAEPAAQPQT